MKSQVLSVKTPGQLICDDTDEDRKPYIREELDNLEIAISDLSAEIGGLYNGLAPILPRDVAPEAVGEKRPHYEVPMASEIRTQIERIHELRITVNFLRFNAEI